MGLFKQKKAAKNTACIIRNSSKSHPFSQIDRYIPLSRAQFPIYEAIREAIPIVDAAILKIIRLVGSFTVECDNREAENALTQFLKSVQTGGVTSGIDSFIAQYLDSLLMYGTAVAEMAIGQRSGSLLGIYNSDLKNIDFKFGENPFQLQVLSRAEDGVMKPVSHSERLLISGINVNSKNPLGRSLLDGLPFISSILLKIYGSIGTNWERIGNLRYAVTYHPGDSSEAAFATDRADEIAREWSAAMSESDSVRDFVAVGDIDIKVIGADNQVLDSQIPVKQMLEQIVAKLGLPPFVLGLSWSTTERMSQQQSDILTSELEYYRSVLEPTILKICNTFLQHDGYRGNVTLNWNDISLQDEVELANARLIRARAQQIEQTLGGAE